jgi:hypothetical protein
MFSAPRGLLLVVAVVAVSLLSSAGGAPPSDPDIAIRLSGPRQVVFDWSREACGLTHSADLPARAFRDDRGRVQLLLSHFDNFRMVGASLDRLEVDCEIVMRSQEDARPWRYRDREWLASPYTTDGRRVWALVHDEYQGHQHPGRCPQDRYGSCVYHAVTLAVSSNGGRRFHVARSPRYLVASPPYRYRAGVGPVGWFAPSNIVERDDYLYAFLRFRHPDGRRGVCLLRTPHIADVRAWRAWTGNAFGGRFFDPYRGTPRRRTDCQPIAAPQIGQMAESLTFNQALGMYILVGMAADRRGGRPQATGVYFSVSSDLIHWSDRRLLMPATTVQTYRCGQSPPIAYPAILDPDSRSRNFATSNRRFYLYFTQLRYQECTRTPDRDLVRVPIEVRVH